MLQFSVFEFYITLRNLHYYQDKVSKAMEARGRQDNINKEEIEGAYYTFADARTVCERAEFKEALKRLNYYRVKLIEPKNSQYKMTLEELYWEYENLRRAIEGALNEKLFMYVPADKAAYHDKPELFGAEVKERFPKANKEIQEAGNCYSGGNNTACVFHLMRATEYGLRALARKLKVPFPKHYELKTWEGLISDIERQIQQIIKAPKTPQRAKDLEFYNAAAAQFRYFKDAWRNHVMHTRSVYDERQAMSVMVHAREFMQHLATRLKE